MKRFDYIDIARGLGILMVVWAHIAHHWTSDLFYTFHMPLFFFISGMMFNRERFTSIGDFVCRRAKRLFVPYVIYSVVTWAIWALFNLWTHRPVDSFLNPLLQTILAQGSGQFMVHNSPLWFIPCLFAVELMFFAIARWHQWVILFVTCSIAGFSMVLEHFLGDSYLYLLPWNFDAAMMALPIYAVGNLIVRHWSIGDIYRIIHRHHNTALLFVLVIYALLTYSVILFGSPSMGHSYYHPESIFHIRALFGSIATLVLAALIVQFSSHLISYIKWLGQVSLDVMCTHVPIKGVLIPIVAATIAISTDDLRQSLGWSFAVFVITMVLDSIVVWYIKRITQSQKAK